MARVYDESGRWVARGHRSGMGDGPDGSDGLHKQGRVMKHWVALLLAFSIFSAPFAIFGTSIFITPGLHVYRYNQQGELVVDFHREVIRGGVWLQWDMECQSLDTKIERRAEGRAFYQPSEINENGRHLPVTYAADPSVEACFADGVPVRFSMKWRGHLFGLLPLRAVTRHYVVEIPPTKVAD